MTYNNFLGGPLEPQPSCVEIVRYGVKFQAQTMDGVKACMRRYYALPRSKRRRTWLVTPGARWLKKRESQSFLKLDNKE
jgi:hypothetical protein